MGEPVVFATAEARCYQGEMTVRFVLFLLLASACDQSVAEPDAGPPDSGVDAGRADAGRDAGPLCAPTCETTEACCGEDDGTAVCVALRNDPRHCGTCEIDCLETHRGDTCSARQCGCGSSTLGCTGNRQSWCCPPRSPESEAYCTDLDRSAGDCGGCGVSCDAALTDRCDGGRCVCGTSRAPCDAGQTCCTAGADVTCVDLASDSFHCGTCNRLCTLIGRCEAGTCTEGTACAGGCVGSAICCNGTCCPSGRCAGGACAPPP